MEIAIVPTHVVPVSEMSEVGTARRFAVALAESLGSSETVCGRVALVATELATNLVLHAGEGQLLLQLVAQGDGRFLEVLSVDNGPGMDTVKCLRDGFSSGGTSGNGLGAVQRLSSEFDLYSQPAHGCVVLSRIALPASAGVTAGAWETVVRDGPSEGWRWGALAVAAPGEAVVGDTWRIVTDGNDLSVMLADGLGHGPLASLASEAAAETFRTSAANGLPAFFTQAHDALRSTRGAAVAAAVCQAGTGSLQYISIGNVSASILTRSGEQKRLLSDNGTVGAAMRLRAPMKYAWNDGDRLVMHSDGISARWTGKEYPNHMQHHPAVLSALLFRDLGRGRDDATVMVLEYMA